MGKPVWEIVPIAKRLLDAGLPEEKKHDKSLQRQWWRVRWLLQLIYANIALFCRYYWAFNHTIGKFEFALIVCFSCVTY
ncbi:hypothetical protein A2V80_02345 [Candidatus Woesebacteria bacterium RBG_16_39_8b]|uniref:Uncharacterized protein n=1 Tax=Candidatus Woesebacteria bacterium RBG_16_39_8b TaxID=1802482 RepID=A0A1F7XAN6_9BACT|nr:MAG: hypothetical protein A2V80_02345 [Candidatus Woesebacteria bacterium RBG_16_39_8b]